MKLTLNHFNSLISLVNHFNSDKRWGGNVVCPFCGCTHTYVCSNGDNQFKCAENSHFFTDELTSYACLDKEGMKHSVIEHGKKEFSKDGFTTNSIEGF